MPRRYKIVVFPFSDEDGGGFAALAPELPGRRSDGGTPERALRNGYDAVAWWIEAALEMGRQAPSPKRPVA